MALVWQCARCGMTAEGTDDQREGRNPPETWLRIYVPESPEEGSRTKQDTICYRCKADLYEWFHESTQTGGIGAGPDG